MSWKLEHPMKAIIDKHQAHSDAETEDTSEPQQPTLYPPWYHPSMSLSMTKIFTLLEFHFLWNRRLCSLQAVFWSFCFYLAILPFSVFCPPFYIFWTILHCHLPCHKHTSLFRMVLWTSTCDNKTTLTCDFDIPSRPVERAGRDGAEREWTGAVFPQQKHANHLWNSSMTSVSGWAANQRETESHFKITPHVNDGP